MSEANLVWLASYPKSGNTWFRIFLANALADDDRPQDINELELSTPVAASRGLFRRVSGWSSSALSLNELRLLQPALYRVLSRSNAELCYLKTHEAYTKNSESEWLHAPDVTRASVYFVRNPLDVCLSWANHCGLSIDRAINAMAGSQWLAGKRSVAKSQYAQQTLSWSQHVNSWVTQAADSLLVLRYEDMLSDPVHAFSRATEFLGLSVSHQRLLQAISFSEFGELQRQEQRSGFAEKPEKSKAFFRHGKAGYWRDQLTSAQIDRVIADHADVMQRYGYLV